MDLLKEFFGILVMGGLVLVIFGYQYLKNKIEEKNKKIIDLEVKGASDAAKNKANSESLPNLVAGNNKRYPAGSSKR